MQILTDQLDLEEVTYSAKKGWNYIGVLHSLFPFHGFMALSHSLPNTDSYSVSEIMLVTWCEVNAIFIFDISKPRLRENNTKAVQLVRGQPVI